MAVFNNSHDSIQTQSWQYSITIVAVFKPSQNAEFEHSHGSIQAHIVFKPSRGRIQAQPCQDLSTAMAVFNTSYDSIQSQPRQYSSEVIKVFKHSHGSIQPQS
jgi:hypothetical protein